MELGELVLFQPVLQAHPTRHSWIIMAHISLGNLECHWKLFTRQLTRTQQFLRSLDQHPSAPAQLLATLQLELSNIQDIYKSSETTITSTIQLLNSNYRPEHKAGGVYSLFLEMLSVGSQELPPQETFTASKPT